MLKKYFLVILSMAFLPTICWSQSISEKNLKKYITYLASDSLHGRETGSVDEIKAATYIAHVFKGIKLSYLPSSDSYFHNFSFRTKKDPHSEDTTNGVLLNSRNVIGYLDNHAKQTIVLGAHYDHLGMGYDNNSLDPNPHGKIHNGADDNASGTAGIMELARVLAKQKGKLKRSIKKYTTRAMRK